LVIAVKDEVRISKLQKPSGVVWVWKRVVLIGIVISKHVKGQNRYCMGRRIP